MLWRAAMRDEVLRRAPQRDARSPGVVPPGDPPRCGIRDGCATGACHALAGFLKAGERLAE